MAFWQRRPRKVRPKDWIRAESRNLKVETRVLEVKRASSNGVRYTTTEAMVEASASTYQSIGRLAGKMEALKGLALYQRMHGSLDGHALQEISQLNDYVRALYRDYQQSLGLALFFPDVNGRLLSPESTGEQYAKALEIGVEAQAKFVEFWKVEGPRYSDGQGGSNDAYRDFMSRYTVETGRPALRVTTDTPPSDIVPPPVANFEFRDGSLRRAGD